ncbi:MAG: DNA replication and repair protein RecF [Flavobacteriaceae bacterium]|nr:DNA replication and repair protein RecF [Flavobacteriaceae bacterium]
MFLSELKIRGFKNFEDISLQFRKKINCFIGPNGIGKTNILDAIYHLSFGKSLHSMTRDCVNFDKDVFFVEGSFSDREYFEKITCTFQRDKNKKTLLRNEKPYKKITTHIGLIPTVVVSPIDRDLIIGSSADRRKFIDGIISQISIEFLECLMNYKRALAQRNAYLNRTKIEGLIDRTIIESFDQQLIRYGQPLYRKRNRFIRKFVPLFIKHYLHICSDAESVNISYQSHLSEDTIENLLVNSIDKDIIRGYTTRGVHRDDLNFYLNEKPLKKYASQGQQKSFLAAMKFAQFEFLKEATNKSPLLLLDDAFDRLDQSRVRQIINLIDQNQFSQIFLTDTHINRTEDTLGKISANYEIFQLD